MFVDRCKYTTKYGVTHVRYLLRESFRENGKVRHRTVLNLTPYGEETALAIQFALKHRRDLSQAAQRLPGTTVRQGLSVGAVWVLFQLAAFGYNRDGKRGKRQVVAGLLCDEEGIPLSIELFRTTGGVTSFVATRFGPRKWPPRVKTKRRASSDWPQHKTCIWPNIPGQASRWPFAS